MLNTLHHIKSFESQHIASRQVDIWLPPTYRGDGANRFPVIYMHDGQNLFEDDKSYLGIAWQIDKTITHLMKTKQSYAAIVVGIWNTPNRIAEYLPYRPFQMAKDKQILTQPTADFESEVLSDAYLRFIVTELKPFIDQTYYTLADQQHTFIMGSSMGGLISLYALCEYPEVFAGAGCVSTHWPVVETVIFDYLPQALPSPNNHLIYFDYGTENLDAQYEPHQKQIDTIMTAAGYTAEQNWITRKFEGADHNEQSWQERVHIPLKFLLGKPITYL